MADRAGSTDRVLLVIWDGLRPEFVNPELTPNLSALKGQGVWFDHHRAVFPSETRVNSATVATGVYPGGHGVVGNTLYVPGVDPTGPLNTGDHTALLALSEQPGGLLSAITLSGRLQKMGMPIAVVSSGSPGSSYLQNPVGNGPMINVRGVVMPEDLGADLVRKYGAFPEESIPATARNDLAVDIFLEEVLTADFPLMVLWLCDPDATQHLVGLGAEAALRAIRENDDRLGRILRGAKKLGVFDGLDVLVGSDHGFSTLAQPADLSGALRGAGFDPDGLVLVSGGIHVRDADPGRVEALARFLQRLSWMGPVFSRGVSGGWEGGVPGTFSQQAVGIEHPDRSPDLVYSRAWTSAQNAFGVPGVSLGAGGTATHGTCSPYDLHNVLVAAGPGFKTGQVCRTPTGNVDLAPTVLTLLGLCGASECDGRVLVEALAGGPEAVSWMPHRMSLTAEGRTQHLEIAEVNGTRYIEKGWVTL